MASISETGHAKNVANFKTLVNICTELGTKYQPTADDLQLSNLQTMLTEATTNMEALKAVLPHYTTAVAEKDAAFKPLSKLVTRVINNFATCGAKAGEVNNATTIAKKITGATKPGKKKAMDGEEPDTVSQSQFSMDMRIDNLNRLIAILAANKNYKPNEPDLLVAPLQALSATLKTHVDSVNTTERPVLIAREQRDITLYDKDNGMVEIALKVKKYTLSSLGSDSAIYKQIYHLKFRHQ